MAAIDGRCGCLAGAIRRTRRRSGRLSGPSVAPPPLGFRRPWTPRRRNRRQRYGEGLVKGSIRSGSVDGLSWSFTLSVPIEKDNGCVSGKPRSWRFSIGSTPIFGRASFKCPGRSGQASSAGVVGYRTLRCSRTTPSLRYVSNRLASLCRCEKKLSDVVGSVGGCWRASRRLVIFLCSGPVTLREDAHLDRFQRSPAP